MRLVRALQISMVVAAGLAVSGCMHRPAPLAAGPSIDALAYNDGVAAMPDAGPRRGLITGSLSPIPAAPPPVIHAAPPEPAVTYAVPTAVAAAVGPTEYLLDAGDKVRVVVYGQDGLTNSYAVGASGTITMPLIGAVRARGLTPARLSAAIAARLRDGYIREPSVAVEVETYRPFFILGEVAAPGQYPYVPGMTVEQAVAIAGGFTPRAQQGMMQLTRSNAAGSVRADVPVGTPLHPGDSIVVGERWF